MLVDLNNVPDMAGLLSEIVYYKNVQFSIIVICNQILVRYVSLLNTLLIVFKH